MALGCELLLFLASSSSISSFIPSTSPLNLYGDDHDIQDVLSNGALCPWQTRVRRRREKVVTINYFLAADLYVLYFWKPKLFNLAEELQLRRERYWERINGA
ncbi:hypothetical protein GIB67_029812 [Kingdonia uniflora]|uniref:Uncharacterized protein n=1 Tax=Kingdonia uniflora TaxID=39325 RepID=A0A7J7NJM1_9MAGN|nr:hypothetical protein GIB67_029812 [Kingdonia uniflora]